MAELSLTAEFDATLCTIDSLAVEHQQAKMYDASLELAEYLTVQLQALQADLYTLKTCIDVDHTESTALWQRTAAELQADQPTALQSLSQVIAEGGSKLLDLVAYLAAARALVRERQRTLAAYIRQTD
jgi:cob(I)alamin adenosyltransferase